MLQPWTVREFHYAEHLLRSGNKTFIQPEEEHRRDNVLTMGEFMLMELYRLGCVDEELLIMLKELFIALVSVLLIPVNL